MNKLTKDQLDMLKRLQPFFEEKNCNRLSVLSEYNNKPLRIPRVYDWQNPEKGLWGMVDWTKFHQELYETDGVIAIYKIPFIEYNEEVGDNPLIVSDPFTALLKALCKQEGV